MAGWQIKLTRRFPLRRKGVCASFALLPLSRENMPFPPNRASMQHPHTCVSFIAKWHKNAAPIFHLRQSCVRKAAGVRRAAKRQACRLKAHPLRFAHPRDFQRPVLSTESQRQRIKPRLSSWWGPFVQRNPRSGGARGGIAMRKIAKSFFASKGAWAKAIAKKRRPTAAFVGVWVEPVHETAIEMRERCRHHALIGLRHAAGFAGGHSLSKSILTS